MKRLFAFLFALVLAIPVFAEEAPDVLIKGLSEEILDMVKKDKELQAGNTKRILEVVDSKVLPHFNFQKMTALAVGKDWRRASPQQQQQLMQEFKMLLVRTYSNALTSYRDQTLRFKPFKMAPGDTDALVRSEVVQPGGKAVQVDYSLEKTDSGWKVYDVTVAGISLVTNYRDSFAQEVRNGGVDGLIQSLAAKNKSLETGNSAGAPANKGEKK